MTDSPRDLRRLLRRVLLIVPAAVALGVGLSGVAGRPVAEVAPAAPSRSAAAPARQPRVLTTPEAAPRGTPRAARSPAAPADDSLPGAAALLAEAAEARRQGDLRATLALLRSAVERQPSVETHAALGGLYFELGAARAAERDLRAAAEGDPGNADRWIALANALALKPDPMAAAGALAQARAAEPGLRVTRDAGGWIVRVPSS